MADGVQTFPFAQTRRQVSKTSAFMIRLVGTLWLARLLALMFAVSSVQQISSLALADGSGLPGSNGRTLQDLFESEFAILRFQANQLKVAGVGFVIHQAPTLILTCYHVVSEGVELNDGPVHYSIARRTELTDEIDVRKVAWSYLKIKRILFKPEYDLAVLEIDPKINEQVADKLGVTKSKPLTLSFDASQRLIGSSVTWLTTAATGDATLTPRLFTGNIVANYVKDEKYSFANAAGNMVEQVITGARMLEVDKLFIPGASGSPILNANTMQVIGYVHGFHPFTINSNLEVTEDAELQFGDGTEFKKEKLKHRLPLVTTISLGIDLRTAESYLAKKDSLTEPTPLH
jgi:hypothetical protein